MEHFFYKKNDCNWKKLDEKVTKKNDIFFLTNNYHI